MMFSFPCPGHHSVMSRHSMFTLAVGFSLGFSLAYMILSAGSLGGRREMFLGPPIHGEQDPHSHDHKVSVRVTSRHISQSSQMVETSVSNNLRQIIWINSQNILILLLSLSTGSVLDFVLNIWRFLNWILSIKLDGKTSRWFVCFNNKQMSNNIFNLNILRAEVYI